MPSSTPEQQPKSSRPKDSRSKTASEKQKDARERARQIAARQAKRGGGSRRGIQIAVVAVLVVVLAIVGVVYWQTHKDDIPDSGPVPASANEWGGIVITKDGIQKGTSSKTERSSSDIGTSTVTVSPAADSSNAQSGEAKLPMGLQSEADAKKNGKPVRLVIFQDYNCIHCAEFEKTYGDQIEQQVLDGKIELEVRNLNFLDAETTTKYSSRAAAAAYSVAEQTTPKQFLDWQKEMFSHQGQGGLKNSEIEDIAKSHGADISSDLDSNKYRPMVNTVVAESQQNGVQATPTLFADGKSVEQEKIIDTLNSMNAAKKK